MPRITPAQLADRLAGPNPPAVLDVRTRSEYARDPQQIPGSTRVLPDQVLRWARQQRALRPVVTYCTRKDEATSARAAQQLRSLGFEVAALKGGLAAWRAEYPPG